MGDYEEQWRWQDIGGIDPPEKPAWISLKITERNRIIDEWRELTDCVRATKDGHVTRLCKMIEAKLKELNT